MIYNPISRWISIEEKLPDNDKRYVVIFYQGRHAWNDDCLGFSSFFTETQEFNHTNILWWLDLPNLPEQPEGFELTYEKMKNERSTKV